MLGCCVAQRLGSASGQAVRLKGRALKLQKRLKLLRARGIRVNGALMVEELLVSEDRLAFVELGQTQPTRHCGNPAAGQIIP